MSTDNRFNLGCWSQSLKRRASVLARLQAPDAPLVSIILATYNTPVPVLQALLDSILAQTYPRWELCVVDDASKHTEAATLIERQARSNPRIRIHRRRDNGGISVATNDAVAQARGDYLAFVDHDDLLEPHALERCVFQLLHDEADVVYTDQATIDLNDKIRSTFHKPDWSPEYFRHVMYVGHLLLVRRSLTLEVGGFDTHFDGVQDFEFMLRVSERTQRIAHVPEVLYYWRAIAGSLADALDAKQGICELQARAVQGHLQRLQISAWATSHHSFPHRCRIQPRLRQHPRVSIIIPTKDQPQLIAQCLSSIYTKTRYPDLEVVLVDNDTTDPDALNAMAAHPARIVPFRQPFNFSAACNAGARASSGEILVFLNNDTEVIAHDWLEHLVFHLAEPDVAVAGGLLLYPDGSVQHAGVVLGARGTADHVMRGAKAEVDGYAGALSSPREVSAVTGACLATTRARFEQVGGFNTLYHTHYQDVDLCLKLTAQGQRCIITPEAKLFHHESPSRGGRYDLLDRLLLIDTWGDKLRADPYYPAQCCIQKLDYSPAAG
ncbi:glycosyltransferase family 2 protein [Lamprobacter modestohalophilus]|uniref:glycosyltransferase family 2 protein n=1 Tax=Lamprobacter modestohalophilus TaxID=1064514 RepID=UPI002ADEC809|nr:glycosyltransferase family 2 protein [Lamprobacter modestohalophilus]MEA1052918.1 glycosyltransferase family 2 protein [Lamprobacter modestohalophilus]